MMTQDRIDQKVTQYVLDNGKHPRFVLLDEGTFTAFTNMLKPRELIKINVVNNANAKIARMACSAGCWVDVLSVNTDDRPLFEVVS